MPLFGWVVDLWQAAMGWFTRWIVEAVAKWIGEAVTWGFDVGCQLVEGSISALSLPSQVVDAVAAWGNLPPLVAWFVNVLGVGTLVATFVAAVLFRRALALVPFLKF